METAPSGQRSSDEFDNRHLCVVATTGTDLDDPGVSAWSIGISWADFVKEFRDDFRVADDLQHLPTRVQTAASSLRDEMLGERSHGLGTLSLIHISEPTRRTPISYAVFCLKKKKK